MIQQGIFWYCSISIQTDGTISSYLKADIDIEQTF